MGYMFLAAQGRCLLCWISTLSLTEGTLAVTKCEDYQFLFVC